ncbi:hypothetical protein QVO32_16655, partial [Bacteroides gallinaceum]|uniref:hypothetical protein n=1 Tax=Bacteroides gallinaceum TaxID=1462571 RepID=UPI0025AAFD16
ALRRVTGTSKAMQTTAIRTVANSLPKNEVILLTLLISKRNIPYTDLRKINGKTNAPISAGFRNKLHLAMILSGKSDCLELGKMWPKKCLTMNKAWKH